MHKDDFFSVRRTLQENLTKWCETFVLDDVERLGSKYSGSPEVSTIEADGYSSGEGTYMTESVQTAMSFDSATSDLTNTDSLLGATQPASALQAPANWAQRIQASLKQGDHNMPAES